MLSQGACVVTASSRQSPRLQIAQAHTLTPRRCEGHDTAAYHITLEVDGLPIRQGCPKCNIALRHRKLHEHPCISQFPMDSPFQRKNDSMRNLILAILSTSAFDIEATDTIGTFLQGCEVFRLGHEPFMAKSAYNYS
jgi:predicted Rossmann fold nucleotide-binding protein DprA/Smf involved in DNA uptake